MERDLCIDSVVYGKNKSTCSLKTGNLNADMLVSLTRIGKKTQHITGSIVN